MMSIDMIIHQSDDKNVHLYYDSEDGKLKISGVDDRHIDPVAKRFIDKSNFFVRQEVIRILRDPNIIESILDEMSEDELTYLLLQYKLMVEKRLFERT